MSKFFRGLFAKRPMANANADLSQLGKCYAMAVNDNGEAEITLYGDIVEEIPRDWWTDEPIEGMYISLEAFLQDLKTLENAKSITVRIHSAGGDAEASITIHNRLRELAKKASITVIVDGIAMSGGSLIMCAGDIVKVNPSSLIMIHKCWRILIGGYNSTELRQIADSNDAYDKAQAAIYRKKTGKPDDELLALMEATYYMTGEEAVEKGFADEVLDGDRLNIAASADRRTLYIDGRAIRLPAAAKKIPNSLDIPTITAAQADAINKNKPAMPGSEGGNNLMAKNLEELRKENPAYRRGQFKEAPAFLPGAGAKVQLKFREVEPTELDREEAKTKCEYIIAESGDKRGLRGTMRQGPPIREPARQQPSIRTQFRQQAPRPSFPERQPSAVKTEPVEKPADEYKCEYIIAERSSKKHFIEESVDVRENEDAEVITCSRKDSRAK